MSPIAFRIGPFAIHWYGLLITTGAMAGTLVAINEARRRGENPDHVWNALSLVLILGIIGARLYHVISSPAGGLIGWDYYRRHPIEIFAFWRGGFQGLGIYGAIAGGLLAVYIYTRYHKLNTLRWLDIGTPGLLLGQAIGRWGNFFNQELYGYPTDLPWGIYIAPEHRLPGLESYERFHPVFLYESLWCFLGFLVLLYIARRHATRLKDGDVCLLYFIIYPLGRFFTESLRPDAWRLGGIPVAQIIAVLCLVVATTALFYRHRRPG